MRDRDDPRGHGGPDRWRRDQGGGRDGRFGGQERRSFGDEGRFNSDQARYGGAEGEREPWRRDRYGSLYDQDRTGYGSGYDREGGGYGRGQGYGGQEYGMEGRGRANEQRRPRGDERQRDTWRPDAFPYGDLEMNPRASGVEEFGQPSDYAFHPPAGHEFDPDYLRWRDEQLRGHDRDYQEWRRHQHKQYDDEYRAFRDQRREHFGRSFHEWRSQRSNLTTGFRPGEVQAGRTDYGERLGETFTGGPEKPSGQLGSPNDMTPDRAMQQAVNTGAPADAHHASDGGSEFGNTPAQVQAASEGGDTRAGAERRDETK